MDNIITLFDNFRQVSYTDNTHTYTLNKKPLISVTQFLSKLKPSFNADYWLTYKVLGTMFDSVKSYYTKEGLSNTIMIIDGRTFLIDNLLTDEVIEKKKELQLEWNKLSECGTIRGSFAHNYLENLERGLIDLPRIITPRNLSIDEIGDYLETITTTRKLCNKYLQETKHLVPIALEFKVADLDLGLAGTFDRLYWNKIDLEYQIHDFKTDKKISTKGKYDKISLFNIPFCELNKYSLQTSLYKYIIEKNTSLKLGQSKITHLNLLENRLDYYDCVDYTQQIKELSNGDNWSTYLKS